MGTFKGESMKIVCDCGKTPKEIDRLPKIEGYQLTEEYVGMYILYQCSCGNKHWEYIKDTN